MSHSTCSIGGCNNATNSRGWCKAHYARWKRNGDPLAGRPSRGLSDTCKVSLCGKKPASWGWCRSHYRRWKEYGDPLHVPPRPVKLCTVRGCSEKHRTGGFCAKHHEYAKRHGTPNPPARECTLCCAEFASIQTKQKVCDGCRRASQNARHGVRPATLADRDGDDCKLCGEPVDMGLAFPHPKSPSVDHIIPWSLGGTHDLENLQLSHLSCNCRKGNRVELQAA